MPKVDLASLKVLNLSELNYHALKRLCLHYTSKKTRINNVNDFVMFASDLTQEEVSQLKYMGKTRWQEIEKALAKFYDVMEEL